MRASKQLKNKKKRILFGLVFEGEKNIRKPGLAGSGFFFLFLLHLRAEAITHSLEQCQVTLGTAKTKYFHR